MTKKILEKIPSMSIPETIQVWRNCIRSLESKDARKVLQAVKAEWCRRRHQSISAELAFAFPTTDAPAGYGGIDTSRWEREGVLKFLGYTVGETDGQPRKIRESILREVMEGPIPPVFSEPYLEQWGEPQTVIRLQKLAETIASLARNAKRRRTRALDAAIRDWESDLDYLYREYYVGKHYFVWPVTSI